MPGPTMRKVTPSMYQAAYATLFGSLDHQLLQFATSAPAVAAPSAPLRAAIPVTKARKAMGECVICKEGIVKDAAIHQTTCAHTFHAACLASWYRVQKICPICRTSQIETRG